MEIGDERVDAFETIGRINKDGRISAARAQHPLLVGDRFQRADGRRADGDDAAAFALGGVDDLRGAFVHLVKLGVHDVMRQILLLNGTEGPQSDVQQHFGDLDAHRADLGKQFLREVQPRRRRGRGAVRLAVDGLVAVLVLELFVDIRRERHGTEAGQNILEHAVKMKAHDAFPRVRAVDDRQGQLLGDDQLGADLRLLPRADEHFPLVEVAALEQQNFDLAAVLRIGIQPRREHLRIVDDEHVARPQIFFDVAENAVFPLSRRAIIDEQP